LTRLISRENFITLSRRESNKSHFNLTIFYTNPPLQCSDYHSIL